MISGGIEKRGWIRENKVTLDSFVRWEKRSKSNIYKA